MAKRLSLDKIKIKSNFSGQKKIFSPVQQNLSDNDPDVDAIYRLLSKKIIFKTSGTNAKFIPPLIVKILNGLTSIPRMYLPTYCSFVCDIWRSLIASKILHVNNLPVTFIFN